MKRIVYLALAVVLYLMAAACADDRMVSEPDSSSPDVSLNPVLDMLETPRLTLEPMLDLAQLYSDAREMYGNNDLEQAYETCMAILESKPKHLDTHLLLAKIILKRDGREAAIKRLEDSIVAFGGIHTPFGESILISWWNLKVLQAEKNEDRLNQRDIESISLIAYLLSSSKCVLTPREMDNKPQILMPMDIYYNFAYYKPPSSFLYPYDGIAEGDYEERVFLDAEKANRFIIDFWGIEIPNYMDDYDPISGYITCQGGMYYIGSEGYMVHKYVLSSYKALGNDEFLVIFDGDGSNLPPEANEPISEISVFIVRRTDTPLGFMVVSKLKEHRLDDVFKLLERPDGFVRVG